MTTTRSTITVYCDEPGCTAKLVTTRTTTAGARGDASRADWAVSRIYSLEPSSDPEHGDLCPEHNPWRTPAPKPQDGPDLFDEGTQP